MEQLKNKWMGVVIPIVAVLVILEAVILMSGISKSGKRVVEKQPEPTLVPVETRIRLETGNEVVRVGEEGEVEVILRDEVGHQIDGVQLYLTYDPEAVEVIDLASSQKLGEAELMTASPKRGLIAVMYLVETPEGLRIEREGEIGLLTLRFRPKRAGVTWFEVVSEGQAGEMVTRIAETETSRAISFVSDKLTVEVND